MHILCVYKRTYIVLYYIGINMYLFPSSFRHTREDDNNTIPANGPYIIVFYILLYNNLCYISHVGTYYAPNIYICLQFNHIILYIIEIYRDRVCAAHTREPCNRALIFLFSSDDESRVTLALLI